MPTRAITDPTRLCRHADHDPPRGLLTAGDYEHECPSCGQVVTFSVPASARVFISVDRGDAFTEMMERMGRVARLHGKNFVGPVLPLVKHEPSIPDWVTVAGLAHG